MTPRTETGALVISGLIVGLLLSIAWTLRDILEVLS